MFRLKDIKTYSISELEVFKAKAMISQGVGNEFSQKLENRIQTINSVLRKRELKN